MKRVDIIRDFVCSGDTAHISIGITLESGSPISLQGRTMLRIYDFLNEDLPEHRDDLCEPKAEQQKPKEEQQKPKKRKPRAEIDLGKVRALHEAGWSYEKIALDEIGCSVATIMKRLKEEAEG